MPIIRFTEQATEEKNRIPGILSSILNKLRESDGLFLGLDYSALQKVGLDSKFLSDYMFESQVKMRYIEAHPLSFLADIFSSSEVSLSIPDQEFEIINNGKKVIDIRDDILQIVPFMSQLSTTIEKEKRLVILAGALGIVSDSILYRDQLQDYINDINKRVGPFVLNMLLFGKVGISDIGIFDFKSLGSEADDLRKYLGQGQEREGRINEGNEDLVAEFLCSNEILIGTYTLRNDNDLAMFEHQLASILGRKRGTKTVSFHTFMADDKLGNFLRVFLPSLRQALEGMVNDFGGATVEEKQEILFRYLIDFTRLPNRPRNLGTFSKNPLYSILYSLSKLSPEIQSRELDQLMVEGKFPVYTFTGYYGSDTGIDHIISFDKATMEEIFYQYSLPAELTAGTYYSEYFLDTVFIQNYKNFKQNCYDTLKTIAEAQGKDYLYFKMYQPYGGTDIATNRFFKTGTTAESYHKLDFTAEASHLNIMNLKKLYSAIIDGYYIRLGFSSSLRQSDIDYLGEISRLGVQYTKALTTLQKNSIESLINNFFTETDTPSSTSSGKSHFLYNIPFSDIYSFFDFYLRATDSQKENILRAEVHGKYRINWQKLIDQSQGLVIKRDGNEYSAQDLYNNFIENRIWDRALTFSIFEDLYVNHKVGVDYHNEYPYEINPAFTDEILEFRSL